MGKKALRGKVKHKPEKIAKALRARKVDIRGNIKRRRGDARHIWKDYSIKAKVLGQRKGGKVVADTNHRVCQLHKKCDCLLLTDMARMAPATNMDATLSERDRERIDRRHQKELKLEKKRGAWKNKRKSKFAVWRKGK